MSQQHKCRKMESSVFFSCLVEAMMKKSRGSIVKCWWPLELFFPISEGYPIFDDFWWGPHVPLITSMLFRIRKGVFSPLLYFCFSDCVTLDTEVNLTSCIATVVLIPCVDNDPSSSH